eukprot:TRINITY_DN107623_c0_g1_i1.p1 TRINITY_DN107623_c0_g1~~TRINITY_DN107623_c0_g1_i1.p1  ORF type:complete len:399 (+),score=66.20 TRINITY_DN107623_c0_g1_i1:41-1237(+)
MFSSFSRGSPPPPPPPPRELRFGVGARVLCNVGRGQVMSGTIIALHYREPGWPKEKTVPYQVQLDYGPRIYVPADSDSVCRKIPEAWFESVLKGKSIKSLSQNPSGDALLQAGAGKDVDQIDFDGETGLMQVVRLNWPNGVATLLGMRANVNLADDDNRCPLHEAVSPLHEANTNDLTVMKMLVDAKADLNCQDIDPNYDPDWTSTTFGDRTEHRTPLHYACVEGNAEAASYLLEARAKLDIQDGQWKTPLHLAIEEEHTDIIDLLLRFGPDVNLGNMESGMNNSPLMDASHKGDLGLVEKLITARADVTQQGKQQMSALHLAVRKRHTDVARKLLESRADAHQDSKVGTALEVARKSGGDILRVFGVSDKDTSATVDAACKGYAGLSEAERKALFLE